MQTQWVKAEKLVRETKDFIITNRNSESFRIESVEGIELSREEG